MKVNVKLTGNLKDKKIPEDVLKKAVDDLSQRIKDGDTVLGYIHDGDRSLSSVSHKIESVDLYGNDLVADIKVLGTPRGKVLETLVCCPGTEFVVNGYCETKDNVVKKIDITSIDFSLKNV